MQFLVEEYSDTEIIDISPMQIGIEFSLREVQINCWTRCAYLWYKAELEFEFTLFNGLLSSAIDLNIFVAYMTFGGEFVFTPAPLSLKVKD